MSRGGWGGIEWYGPPMESLSMSRKVLNYYWLIALSEVGFKIDDVGRVASHSW